MVLKRLIRRVVGRPERQPDRTAGARQSCAGSSFVAFLTPSDEVQSVSAGERLFASWASTRLRVLIPAAELARRLPVLLVPLTRFIADPSLKDLGAPHAIVVSKLTAGVVVSMQAELSDLLDSIADGSCRARLFADLSDDYAALAEAMRAPFLEVYQRRLAELCTLVVPCAALRDAVAPLARHGIEVIEDPYETIDAQPVRTRSTGTLRLCWFGNLGAPTNARGLREALVALARSSGDIGCRLELVASEQSRPLGVEIATAVNNAKPAWSVEYTAWSPAAVEAAIARSDFVVLPQEHRTAWGRVKSHNRLVQTIRCGRLAIASPIPSYAELADYAWVGESIADGLRWALQHPEHAAARVASGQAYVAEHFSPEAIGAKWARALGV
jgi:glycosyltransferase involved in cell wall biosynthesis